MELKDLKRGMRVTFRNGDVRVIDYSVYDFDGYYKIICIINMVTTGFTLKMNNIYSYYDIVEIEDLSGKGDYYTIWKREEPKFYIKPKGMDMRSGVCMNLNIETNKWFSCFSDGEDKYFKSQFTIEEMIELGLDPDNFDKELVC